MDWANDAFVEISLTLAYDYAILQYWFYYHIEIEIKYGYTDFFGIPIFIFVK
jgi:hypothetical protein